MHSKRKVHFAQIANVLLENSTSRKIAEGGGVGMKSSQQVGPSMGNVELAGTRAQEHDHIPNTEGRSGRRGCERGATLNRSAIPSVVSGNMEAQVAQKTVDALTIEKKGIRGSFLRGGQGWRVQRREQWNWGAAKHQEIGCTA